MRINRYLLGTALFTFGAGMLLSCLLPAFILVCLLALILLATGFILLNKH